MKDTRLKKVCEDLKLNRASKIDLSSETPSYESKGLGTNEVLNLSNILKSNTKCRELNLYGNKIGDKGAIELANVLEVNNTLEKLNLWRNNITDEGAIKLAHALTKNDTLYQLELTGNMITDRGAIALAQSLLQNHSLQQLDLLYNKITDNSIWNEIKKRLTQNTEHSYILVNQEVNWKEILEKKEKIQVLRLINCSLTELPEEIKELKHLIILDLRNNKFKKVPSNLEKLKNLISINFIDNEIDYEFFKLRTIDYFTFSGLCDIDWKFGPNIKRVHFLGNTNYSQKTIGVAIHYAFPLIIDKTMEENFRNSCKVILWIAYSNKVSIDNFREKITEYMNLQQLDLGSLQLIYIPDEISQLKLCTYLRLKDNKLTDVPTSLLSMTWLIKLDLQYNQLSGIPLGIEKMSSLNEIWLEGNHFIRFPVSLSKVSRLQNIWLDNNQITKFEDCSMPNLQRLSITKNKSFSALDSLVRWELLQFLFLDENDLKSLSPEIKNLKQLKILHLNKNLLTQLPEEFGELKNLERLQIRENLLQELPARIGELLNLKSLNLYHNQLTKLPVTMAFMTQLEHLVLKGNPLQSPPIEICQDWSSIQTYFLDYLSGQKACNFVKMIVVGEENVGKTTLIRALKAYCSSWFTFSQDWNIWRQFHRKPLSTDGIEITLQALEVKNSQVPDGLIFNIWDFGGQKVYYSTHVFFLSERALYVIVWNVAKEGEKERIIAWANTIQSLVNNPTILLVGTHLDEISDIQMKNLYDLYKELSEQTRIPVQNILSISCNNGENFKYLVRLLVKRALALPMVGKIFPKVYLDLKIKLEEEMKVRDIPIIDWSELTEIGKQCNIVGKGQLQRAIQFLHILGFCLHFSKDKQLKKYIVINPQWLANAMASLISTKSIFISNQKGILDHQHLRTVWKEYSPNLHKLLLDLMEKFYVAIPISEVKSNIYEGQSVIPALLSDIQPPDILASWDVRDNRLKRFYQFNDLLPVDLFSRLAGSILLGMGIRRTRFWKDGMMIFEEDSKSLILVCSKEKGLLLCFSGKEWFNLFRKVKIILEMLLNKWEHLRITKYVVCPTCCQFNPLTEWHYCFEWKECYQAFYQEETLLLCEKAKKSDKIVNLIPELVRSEIPKTQKNKIILFEKIGEGSFAQVYKGEYKKEEVAVKQMKPGIIQDEEEALRRFFQEMELLHNEDHPNLLNVKAMVLSPLWLILPFAKYGSLYDYLHILRGQWKWPLPLRIAFDVACGINYLHNLDLPIIHCDLRSPNILLFSINYTDSVVAKVGDFGMSQYSLGRILLKDKKRTNPNWTPPEVIEGKDICKASDVYGFGIMLYEMLAREIPFFSRHNPDWKFKHHVENAVLKGLRPPVDKEEIEKFFSVQIDTQIFELLKSCWHQDPIKRPTFQICVKICSTLLQPFWSQVNQVVNKSQMIIPSLDLPEKETQSVQSSTDIVKIEKIGTNKHYSNINYFKCSIKTWNGVGFLKELNFSNVKGTEEALIQFFNEMKIFKFLSSKGGHPNLIQMVGQYQDKNVIDLVLEYYGGGTLESLIYQRKNQPFSNLEIAQFAVQILRGLNFLHHKKIAHRTLKSSTILLDSAKRLLHLGCFKNATFCEQWKLEQNKQKINKVREYFMAPELVLEEELDLYAADIWSYGILLYELICGKKPENFEHSLNLSDVISAAVFKEAFEKCLQIEKEARPSSFHLLKTMEDILSSLK